MKTFTTEEIRDLLNQVYNEEINFSQMVEVINKRMSETNKPQYKNGDFVINKVGSILIFREKVKDSIYDHAYFNEFAGIITFSNRPSTTLIERHATEEEKKKMLDEIAKEDKRWNVEKKCIEDIPEKLKKGDLAIFWDKSREYSYIGLYNGCKEGMHRDSRGNVWKNAIKFESKEQFEVHIGYVAE